MSDNIVSAFINGVEHFASDIEELVTHAIDALANLGISTFNGMEWFIHFLIQMQEDPVHVISRMAARIAEIGASVIATLEEIVNGIRTHGLTGYVRIKVQGALTPFHNTMSQQVSQSNQLTTLHQNTLTTMQQKLDTLKNNGTDANWRGPSVDAMSATFTLHASTLTTLTTAFNNQNTVTNKYAQDTALDNFMTMLAIFALVDLLIILCSLVAAPFTVGASVLAAGGLLEEAILIELAALLIYSEIYNLSWQHATSGLYFVTTQQTQTQQQTGSGSDGQDKQKTPKPVPPIPPVAKLTQQQEQDLADLTREFPTVSPDDIKGLLLAGFTAAEIRAILNAGFTSAQIQAIITRIKTAQNDQHGTDKLGLTTAQILDLVNRVAAAVNSPDEDTKLEGEVARPLIDDLVAFKHKVIDPATGRVIGEIDVETSKAIIEVSSTDETKLKQVRKEKDNKLINPKGKQVILYAPGYSHAADQQFKSYGIPIIRSFKDLFDYLRSL